MPPTRMTANPVRPARYRPGRPTHEERSSSSSEDSDAEEQNATTQSPPAQTRRPPPSASSFPGKGTAKVAAELKNVDLAERRRRTEAAQKEQQAYERREQEKREREAGFETESGSGSEEESEEDEEDVENDTLVQGGDYAAAPRPTKPTAPSQRPPAPNKAEASSSGSEESSEEDSSEEEDTKSKLIRPLFIKKSDRQPNSTPATAAEASSAREAADALRRQQHADALVQNRLELDAAARAAGKKSWDDDAPDEGDYPDDTDGLDPDLERAQWTARELTRLKRSRAQLEEREAELAEIERRRNMSASERDAEDRAHVESQREAKASRGAANVMQKYHHSGAFFQDDSEEAKILRERNLMGAQYADQSTVAKELFKVRDVAKIGRKGQVRHRDLKSDDTGAWGGFLRDERRRGGMGMDERFRPDGSGGGPDATGANLRPLGEKRGAQADQRQDDMKRQRIS